MMADPEIPVLDGQTTIEEVLPPKRIQRRRVKGWRMPPNTVYVGRGSRWGNPFAVGSFYETRTGFHDCPFPLEDWKRPFFMREGRNLGRHVVPIYCNPIGDSKKAVDLFRLYVAYNNDIWDAESFRLLRGKNLACWCRPDQACHADVLLELANPVEYTDCESCGHAYAEHAEESCEIAERWCQCPGYWGKAVS